jgi:hypothetical protein
MRRAWRLVGVFLALVALTGWPLGQTSGLAQSAINPAKVDALDMTLRHLLVDHVFWVRSLAVAAKSGNAEAADVAYRMALNNARDLGQAVASFYGQPAGEKFSQLFTGHVNAVKSYWDAAARGDEAGKRAASTQMTQNGDQLATFLSSANPNLPKAAVLSLLQAHVAVHVGQCTAIVAGNWKEEAQTWDAMLKNVYSIADALAQGIAKQFPSKFS